MSVIAKHIVGLYYFDFTCPQWANMDDESLADWEVVSNNCGFTSTFGAPYASAEFVVTLEGVLTAGDGISVVTLDGITTITNTAPDLEVVLTDGTGIDVTGTYPNFTITNTAPDQVVTLTEGSGITITGTYPNFTIAATGGGSGTVTSVGNVAPAAGLTISGTNPITTTGTWTFALANDLAALEGLGGTGIAARTAADTWAQRAITASTGISVADGDGVAGNPTITNTAPDQTVVLNNGTGISVTGTYPNFTIANTVPGVSDGDKGDIVVSGSGTVWTIDTNVVSNAKLRQSVGLSVIGRSAGTTGDVADIVAGTDAYVLLRTGGVVVFGQIETGSMLDGIVTTAKITDNAVTIAKFQQIATDSFLGRDTAGTGNVEVLTGTQATSLLNVFTSVLKGLVPSSGGGTTNYLRADGTFAVPPGAGVQQSGTLVDERIAISAGSNLIKDDAAFTVDTVNDRMKITGTVAGTGANNAWLNLNGGAITGNTEAWRGSANISGNFIGGMYNANNANAAAGAVLYLSTGGASGGDPMIQFNIAGVTTHAFGIDNSDADKIKLTPGASLPGGSVNKGMIWTTDALTRVGINRDAPLHPLDVSGIARSDQFRMGSNVWSAANIALGSGAGVATGATINSISGGNNGLQINFTTGTAPVANGIIFTATYPTAYGSLTYVVKDGRGDPGGINYLNEAVKFNIDSETSTSFVLKANGTLTASKLYALSFIIMGY